MTCSNIDKLIKHYNSNCGNEFDVGNVICNTNFCKFQEWEEEMDKVQEQLKKVNGEREEDAVQIQEYNVSRGES